MKKLFAAACCAVLLTMSIGAVCPAAASETESASEEQKTEKVKKQIGEKTEEALKARLTNATKKDITGLAIKGDTDEEFTENLMDEEQVLSHGEIGILYYTPESSAADEEEATYVIRLTFGDDTTADLHGFSFSKMKKARIRLEDGIAYLVYNDGEEKINTLEAEQELAKEEEAAAQDTGEVVEYEDYYEDTYYEDSSDDGGSYDSSYDNSGSDDSSYDNSSSDSGSYDDSSSGGGDAGAADENCLVGGLMN